jgi:predicted MFS family arabinose efflux permease
VYPQILAGDRYVAGTAVTLTTNQLAQVAGFATGGVVVAFLGVRASLLADAATFGASALIIRARIRARPAARPHRAPPPRRARQADADTARPSPDAQPGLIADAAAGLRLVLSSPAMRTPMLFGWLAAFYNVPEGVAAPLARAGGGGAATAGLILAAPALGSTIGALGFSRLVDPPRRAQCTGPLAVAACGILALFAARPALPGALLILAGSGILSCYQLAANASFVQATPPSQRSQAFGLAQGGMSLGQGTAMIVAGAAAQHLTPATVIAAAGCLGALAATAVCLHKRARQATAQHE